MKVKKHLTLDDRICIQQELSEQRSFKAIAEDISKDCTTVSKEVRNHLVFKKKSVELKVDKSCRVGRTYDFFLHFRKEHPSLPVVELDSVEGKKGRAVLLTIHFVLAKLQLAYRREANDSASVTAVFDELYESLGPALYKKLFPILLCDNGTEFSNPRALEFDTDGNRRSYVFYCDPATPGQKGACENNHEMIRRVIPKGVDITPFTQTQILTMMSHINSYGRPDLGDRSPYELFEFYYGRETLEKFGIRLIPSNGILLKPALLRHSDAQTVNNK